MESACLCLPKFEISGILYPHNFKGNEVWCVYPSDIYDFSENPEELHYFFWNFQAHKEIKMKSFFTTTLACILFRPHLMSEKDFQILRTAIDYFDCPSLCIQCGKKIFP